MHRVGAGFCIWTFSTSRPSKSEDDALCQQTNHLDARRDSSQLALAGFWGYLLVGRLGRLRLRPPCYCDNTAGWGWGCCCCSMKWSFEDHLLEFGDDKRVSRYWQLNFHLMKELCMRSKPTALQGLSLNLGWVGRLEYLLANQPPMSLQKGRRK